MNIEDRIRFHMVAGLREDRLREYLNSYDTFDEFEEKEGVHIDTDTFKSYLTYLKQNNINIISLEDEAYPEKLKELYLPPPLLYTRGALKHISSTPAVAIVGTRKSTLYGNQVADWFAKELSNAGFLIVSGLAKGIDAHAHRASLSNGTVAVLGNGIDIFYPALNRTLEKSIIEKGLVITEFLFGTPPLPQNFLKRNRIIAGLAQAVIVIEAGEKSGALNTVKWAVEYGREVFVVPGPVNSPVSKGTNNLIKEGFNIVTEPEEIIEALGIGKVERKKEEIELTPLEEKVYEKIGIQPIHIDDIVALLEMDVKSVFNTLLSLELKGVIEDIGGKKYTKKFI